jgi:two-component SAPR family response regulator
MIKTIIVDDEQPSINILKRLLNNSGKAEVKATFNNSIEALEYLKNNTVDVAFLDIEMPYIDGLELVNIINSSLHRKCRVVFVTAYNQYAIDAFTINALDYLLKPIKRDRLNLTLDRIIEELGINISSKKMDINCFGKFKVFADNEKVKFRTKKSEELIAILIDSYGKNVARSRIIDCLWSDFEGDKALINFNTTLYYVRKALAEHGLEVSIIYERESYRIDISNIECDYFQFNEYVLPCNNVEHNNILEVHQILDLYRDDYLVSNDYKWSISSSLNLKEKYIRLILLAVDYYANNNDTQKAITLLKDAFLKECNNDAITYKLMKFLINDKKYSLALKYYNSYKKTLKELGRKPNKSFNKLIDKI